MTPAGAPLIRVPVAPGAHTGLRAASWIMAARLTTLRRTRLGQNAP